MAITTEGETLLVTEEDGLRKKQAQLHKESIVPLQVPEYKRCR